LLFIPLWWFLYRDKPAESSHVSKQELAYIQASAKASIAHHGLTGIREILKNKTLLANTWGYFVFGFYLFFFMNWMPEYLSKTFHYKLSKIGLFSTIPWLTAAVMTLIVGWFTDLVYTKTQCLRYSRTYPLIVSHLVSGVALIPLWMSHDIYWILLSLSLSVGAVMSVNAVYYSVNVDVAKERAATSFGVMGLLFSLSGILSPVLTGWIVNFSGQFQSVFILMLILSLSSSLILWLFHNGHAK
jgi:sugar phosphate permease